MWCWAHGLECGVDKWKFLSPVLKQPKLRQQQQQYEDFSILDLLVMSVAWGPAENTFFSFYIQFLGVISPSATDLLVAYDSHTLGGCCCSYVNQIDLSPKPNSIFFFFNGLKTN